VRRLGPWLMAPALLVLVLLAVVPIVGALWQSLFHETAREPARWAGLENYARLARDPEARNSLLFTLQFVGTSVVLELLFGLATALVLHARFRGRAWVRASVLIPWAIPTVVASWIWRYIFDDYSGVMTYVSDVSWFASPFWARTIIILADVWKTMPFTALLILAGLQTVPDELIEAARIDGAGPWRRFKEITLPLLRPAILVALLFRTIDAFRVFDLVFVMTRGKSGTSVLQYQGYKALFDQQDYGMGTAISAVVFLLVATMSVIYVRTVPSRLMEADR
jgi:trehalose/maltose transport system permease protein